LKEDINAFITQKKGASNTYISFANFNNIQENTQGADNKLIASIASIEEEKALKIPENFIRQNNEITYKQPPVWVNVLVIFTYYTRNTENYDGIDLLGNVMQYFQSKPILNKNSVLIPANFPTGIESIRSELVNLNYDQANNLWGIFGGKYYPSVIYKFKSLPIDNMDIVPGGPPILETEVEALHKYN
jgi:hypothetical protein